MIDLLAAPGRLRQGAKVTDPAISGELDFTASLRERVALPARPDAQVLDKVRARLRVTEGARTPIRTLAGTASGQASSAAASSR